MNSVPPGIPFLVRTILSLSLAPVATIFIFQLLPTELYVFAPRWLPVILALLSVPALFTVRVVWQSWCKKREAARMGARLAPVQNGKWIGNIDILIGKLKQGKEGYLGDPQKEAICELGNIYNARVFWEDNIITVEPDHIKAVLATEFNNYVKGEQSKVAMTALLGTGVFNSDGDMWKFHRSMTRPFFSRDRISHFDIFDRHADEAIGKMKQRLNEGVAVDFQDLIARFTLDSATEFLFGNDVRSLSAPLPYPYNHPSAHRSAQDQNLNQIQIQANIFADSFLAVQELIANRRRVGNAWPALETFKDETKEPMKVVSAYVERILTEALAKKEAELEENKLEDGRGDDGEGQTLLEHLAKFTSDPVVLKDEILNILLAGRDTTAVTLTYTTYFLAMYPSVLDRLRAEVLEKVGPTRRPTYDDIRDMKYLRAVLNETLRLYPAVPFNSRESIHATTLSSPDPMQKPIYVPAKTRISYSVFFLHRRKDLWGPDAEEYDPDRFLDERLKKYLTPNPFIFLPFNAGPRICLGQQFAYNEMSFMLIRLLQNFSSINLEPSAHAPGTLPPKEWANAEGRKGMERVLPKSHLTLYCKGGLWVNMKEAEKEI